MIRRFKYISFTCWMFLCTHAIAQQTGNESFSVREYLMKGDKEIALAKSAAPNFVSDYASIMVLRETGYETVVEGENGFVCIVLRSWGESSFDPTEAYDPTTLDPECMDAQASRSILPMQLYRAKLGLRGTPAEEIRTNVQDAFRRGELSRIQVVGFSYMMSLGMTKHRPHVMFYYPDGSSDTTFANRPNEKRVIYVIGGDDEPYIAAVIPLPDKGIRPDYPAH